MNPSSLATAPHLTSRSPHPHPQCGAPCACRDWSQIEGFCFRNLVIGKSKHNSLPRCPSSVCPLPLDACRDWSQIEGFCFRNLIIGKTNTLNFYQAYNGTEAAAAQVRAVFVCV